MIKSELLKLLSPYIVKSYDIDDGDVQNVSSVLQNAKREDLVFYNINDGIKFEEVFLERLKKSEASLVFINRPLEMELSIKNLIVLDDKSFQSCLKKVVDEFYPYDLKANKLVGITGTNGKTTTAYLAMQIASLMGYPSICIGTLGIQSIDKVKTNQMWYLGH
jgi:UDP-N-acetylmuramoyl-L-alanyl-D-glutamate--2,6-diaminopimelate ligase